MLLLLLSRFSCVTVRPHRRQPTRLPHPWDSPGKNTGVGCHFLLQCMKVKSEREAAQSCPTLQDPMDGGAWWAAVYGVAQSRTQLKRLSSSCSSQGVRLEVLRRCPPPKTVSSLCDVARDHRTGLRQDGSHVHLRQGETQAPQFHSGPHPGWAEWSSPQINRNETLVT